MLSHLFELLPVAIAIVNVVLLSIIYGRRSKLKRKFETFHLIVQVFCSLLLIVAQLSWYNSFVINENLIGTMFANHIWTIFNTVTMASFTLNAITWFKALED